MAFQHTMHNRRRDQQVPPIAEQLSPGCMRHCLNKPFQHEPLLRYSSLQENLLHSQRVRQSHLLNPAQIRKAASQQEAFDHRHLHNERLTGGGVRRRNRLSFSRWHMMISSRYKTELCRQFSEDGDCPFEEKCLFAHGNDELRPLPRHPKYKTELCRDFHQVGFCSFGPRCNFIHSTTDITSITTAMLRTNGRSSTPDSGNESCDDQSSTMSASASPLLTPDHIQDDETFFHFPEGLFREITEGTADEVSENTSNEQVLTEIV